MGRIIIFSGKGGVGKTSVAAAHALKISREGKKTILISADRAHNIGDVFETEVGSKITAVGEHLDALELEPEILMREEYPQAAAAIWDLLGLGGFSEIDPLDGSFLPGLDDLFSLLKIEEIYRSGIYDRILVDCAPTAATLSLLTLPELLQWYMERFFPVGKAMIRVLSPIASRKYQIQLPKKEALNEIERAWQKLVELQEILKDPQVTTVRLVCIPEKMVLSETKRDFMYLSLYRYPVEGVFINRVLPEEADNPFLQRWRNIQQGYVREYEEIFRNVPLVEIPWLSKEVRGRDTIDYIAAVLPEEESHAADTSDNEVYSSVEDGYCLTIRLPFAEREEVRVAREGLDLLVTVRGWRRRIPLPNVFAEMTMSGRSFQDGILQVFFTGSWREAGECR